MTKTSRRWTGAAFPFCHQNALLAPSRQTSIKKRAICPLLMAEESKGNDDPGTSSLCPHNGGKRTDEVWGDGGKLLAREVNKITSVFNPVPPLTFLRPTWSSKHKDLENEKDFSSDKGRKEEIKSCKQGEQRSYDSILCISQWSFILGIRITHPLCQMLQIRGHYPLLPQRVEIMPWLKHLSQYGSTLLLRKRTN